LIEDVYGKSEFTPPHHQGEILVRFKKRLGETEKHNWRGLDEAAAEEEKRGDS